MNAPAPKVAARPTTLVMLGVGLLGIMLLLLAPPLGYVWLVAVAAASWRFPALGVLRPALTVLAGLAVAALVAGWGTTGVGSAPGGPLPRPAATPAG